MVKERRVVKVGRHTGERCTLSTEEVMKLPNSVTSALAANGVAEEGHHWYRVMRDDEPNYPTKKEVGE